MEWIYLILAIIFEVCGTTSMKLSEGFSKLIYAGVMMIFYLLSLTMLTFALKKIEIGRAYAIWSGFGTALIATIGILFFKEALTLPKILFIGLIIIGVVGLNLISTAH